MKYILLIFGILNTFYSIGQIEEKVNLELYPLKEITCSCQSTPNQVHSKQKISYYKNNRIKEIFNTSTKEESDTSIVSYFYSDTGLLDSINTKTFVGIKGYVDVFERTRIFKYNANGKLIYSGFDDEKGNNLKNDYQYSNDGQLQRKIVRCGSNMQIYSYNYDKNGNVIKEYKNNRLLHRYKYNKENQLETKITYSHLRFNVRHWFYKLTHRRLKNHLGTKTLTKYEYDTQNNIIQIIEGDNVIDSRKYENGRLIEKRINYYGIDPCFAPCCSQYIYRYKY